MIKIERLNQAMQNCNFNDSQLAKMIGKTRATVSMYKSGKVTPPLEVVEQIAKGLNVSTMWLLGYDDSIEYELSKNYKQLDEVGKRKVIEYIKDMAKIYSK